MRSALASLALLAAFGTPSPAEDADPVTISGLTFDATGWSKVPTTSPMRAATLAIEAGDETLEVVFFYFGAGQGGDVEANIQRWITQFDGKPDVERSTEEVGEHKVALLTAKGTYLDGPPFGEKTPKPDHTLLGAILEGRDAPVFLRLTGPNEAVAKVQEAFIKLATSPHKAAE